MQNYEIGIPVYYEICHRGKNKVAFIFSNESVLGQAKCFAIDDDENL